MYQPVPLNWNAGDEISFCTGPLPHLSHTSSGSSENFRIFSNVLPHASHRYSYRGMLFEHFSVGLAEHQRAVQPERHRPVREQRVVEAAERVVRAGVRLVVLAQLQDRQLSSRVQDVGRIEGASLGLAPGA